MKGNPKLVETLNALLSDELTAINQYIVHAKMCESWGCGKLHDHFEKRAIEEMKKTGMLFSQIMLQIDNEAEEVAITGYNEAIKLACEIKDFATREILEHILSDDDAYIDAVEDGSGFSQNWTQRI